MRSPALDTRAQQKRNRDLMAEARTASEVEDFARAAALAEQLVSSEPANLKYRNLLSYALARQGSDRAFAFADSLNDTRWERFALRAALLRLAVERGDERQIAHQLSRLFLLSPNSDVEYQDLIQFMQRYGREPDAGRLEERRRTFLARHTALSSMTAIAQQHPSVVARYAVNIGCRDGKSWADPTFDLFTQGWAGLAIDAGNYPAIYDNLPQTNVTKLLNTTVTPSNIVELLQAHRSPRDFDLLKIDIDSFDGVLLQAILAEYRPHLIQMEVNPEIPPPIAFSVLYDDRYRHGGDYGFFGCSLSYVMAICRPRGYEIVDLDLSSPPTRQDVLLGKQALIGSAQQMDERERFLAQRPIRSSFMDIGIDTRVWRTITEVETLFAAVWDACCLASVARSGGVLPFHLSVYRPVPMA